jgi:hypothetical protein
MKQQEKWEVDGRADQTRHPLLQRRRALSEPARCKEKQIKATRKRETGGQGIARQENRSLKPPQAA